MTQRSESGLRKRKKPGRATKAGGEDTDQFGCREIDSIAGEQRAASRTGVQTGARHEINKVLDEDETTAIIDGGKGQRQAVRDKPQQRAKISFDPRTVDQRRAENDEFDAGFSRHGLQCPLTL